MAKRARKSPAPIAPKHRPIPVNADLMFSHPLLHNAAWKPSSNYVGDDLTGRSVVMTTGPDDVSRANWKVANERTDGMVGIEFHKFGSRSSKFECLMVRHDAPPATLDACEAMLRSLVNYPCLDDMVLSAVQAEMAAHSWESWGRDELRTAIRDRDLDYVAIYVYDQKSDADIDRLFKAACADAGVPWYDFADGDAQFPIDDVAGNIADTLARSYSAETRVIIERELSEYHRDQLCLPGFDGCMPDVELLGPKIEAEREAALYL